MAGAGPEKKEQASLLENEQVAELLSETGRLLEEQGANPYRARAYQKAADLLRSMTEPVLRILEAEGRAGLMKLPGIGQSLSRSIELLLDSGRLPLLDRLRGRSEPERTLQTVGTVGPVLAHRIHEHLGVETLQDLEQAAFDGRLGKVPGMGPKRVRTIRESLAGRFRRFPKKSKAMTEPALREEPPVAELLDVDLEYRTKAEQNCLPKITPHRFNPTHTAWLPILHTERGEHHYTALYSNTARAHELGTVRDWVIIYRDDHEGDGQWTVITSTFGALRGRRIVRGREGECEEHYRTCPTI